MEDNSKLGWEYVGKITSLKDPGGVRAAHSKQSACLRQFFLETREVFSVFAQGAMQSQIWWQGGGRSGMLRVAMNLNIPICALVGLVALSAACSDESGGRSPVVTPSGSGGAASGGKPGAGTGGMLVVGSGGSGGTKSGGASSGGTSAGGTGGGNASGGTSTGGAGVTGGAGTVLDLSNCDTATLAALFNARRCDDCHFGPNGFHIVASLEGWVGKMGMKTATLNCPTRTVVVPGDAETSLLYIKLAGTPPAECGQQMPEPEKKDAPLVPFTSEELKCVADWINGLPGGSAGGAGGADTQ
ncbi:MAG: hypothetical protein SFV15_12325 [Polyangiaceae bacterium]|nr:hypothetical protein [Polyangiaceae bacterium]